MTRMEFSDSGFCLALEKTAGPMLQAAIQRGLGGVGAGAGLGALGGVGIGAVRGYRQARQEGQSGAGAVMGALGGAAKGVVPGALIGGAGLGALQAAGVAPGLAGQLARGPGPIGAFARSGQRQVHSLTGWTPRGFGDVQGIKQVRMGSYDAAKRHSLAFKNMFSGSDRAQAEMARASRQLSAAAKAEQMGLTSLPGFAKSVVKNPLETIRAGVAEQWHGSPGMTAATLGLTGLGVASELKKSGPEAEGRGSRVAGHLTNLAMLPLGAMPLAAQFAVGAGTNKLVGKLRPSSTLGQNPAPPEVHPSSTGLSSPVEHVYSDRASGQIRVGDNP